VLRPKAAIGYSLVASEPKKWPAAGLPGKIPVTCTDSVNFQNQRSNVGCFLESKRIAELDIDVAQLRHKRVVLVAVLQTVIEDNQGLPACFGYPYESRIQAKYFRYVVILE